MFPCGPWTGFYNYQPGQRHRMDLHLAFVSGQMSGDGSDDVGRFTIRGRYDVATKECWWTKTYPGSHDVAYRGFREGKGIWGTWEIKVFTHGGFHIWPLRAGEDASEVAVAMQEEPTDAVTREPEPSVSAAGISFMKPRERRRSLAALVRGPIHPAVASRPFSGHRLEG